MTASLELSKASISFQKPCAFLCMFWLLKSIGISFTLSHSLLQWICGIQNINMVFGFLLNALVSAKPLRSLRGAREYITPQALHESYIRHQSKGFGAAKQFPILSGYRFLSQLWSHNLWNKSWWNKWICVWRCFENWVTTMMVYGVSLSDNCVGIYCMERIQVWKRGPKMENVPWQFNQWFVRKLKWRPYIVSKVGGYETNFIEILCSST